MMNLCIVEIRAVAQFGSALRWGRRGRWFKSSQPDQLKILAMTTILTC